MKKHLSKNLRETNRLGRKINQIKNFKKVSIEPGGSVAYCKTGMIFVPIF